MRFDRLSDWLGWQESLHPANIELGLDRVRPVFERLGAVPAPLVISVGGTNGKGSCAALLEAILVSAGYRVGRYSSPHLLRYNERICVDGDPVSDERLMAAFERVENARQDTPLTYFEYGTLAAFDVFSDAGLDVAVLEVGLGGRLDAVNLVDADLALITTVDLDHSAWLGNDRESIGREKAGIFRRGLPAVYGAVDPPRSVLERAAEIDVPLWIAGRDFHYELSAESWSWHTQEGSRQGLPMPRLRGKHQLENAVAVLTSLHRLSDRLPVDQRAVRAGLLSVELPGRFEVRPGAPTLVMDVAHNPQAVRALNENLRRVVVRGRLLAVFGAFKDKDIEGMVLPLADMVDHWYLGQVAGERGLNAGELGQRGGETLDKAAQHDTIVDAFEAAWRDAEPEDTLLVFGSFLTLSAIMEILETRTPQG